MRIEHLEIFIKVCDAGSLSKAAKQLFMSQSTISTIIAGMEKELGFSLLKRSVQGVIPTDEGKLVLKDAYEICDKYSSWLNIYQESSDLSGVVCIGLPASFRVEQMNAFTIACMEKYPNIRLKPVVAQAGNCDQLLEDLSQRNIAFAYGTFTEHKKLAQFINSPEWQVECLFKDKLHVIMHKYHHLANEKNLSLSQLKELTLIFPSDDNKTPVYKYSSYFKTTFRCMSMNSMFSAMKNNEFVTFMPKNNIFQKEREDFVAIPVDDNLLTEEISYYFVHLKKKYMSTVDKLVMELFKTNYLTEIYK